MRNTKSITLTFLLNLILLLIFLVNSAYSADIYKWTDADGNVHFGDNPEDNPAAVYKVPKNNATNISSTNKERAEKQKKLLDSLTADRRAKEEKRAKKIENSKTRKYNCQVSKDKLKRYKKASKLYVRNDIGEKIYLGEKQRQEETNLLGLQVKHWCQ